MDYLVSIAGQAAELEEDILRLGKNIGDQLSKIFN